MAKNTQPKNTNTMAAAYMNRMSGNQGSFKGYGSPNMNYGNYYGATASKGKASAMQTKNSGNVKSKNGGSQKRQLTEKELKKLKRAKKREKDYFYIMRKFPAFLIFVFCLVVFAVSLTGVLGAFMGESLASIDPYVSVFVRPDLTPMSLREDIISEDENGLPFEIVYEDKTQHISLSDIMFGALGGLSPSLNMYKDEEGESKAVFFDTTLEALDNIPEEIVDPNAAMAGTAFKFAPLLMFVAMIASLIAMITSFLAVLGKRIFKGFGLAGLLMLVSAGSLIICGLVGNGVYEGKPLIDEETEEVISVLDFSQLMPFMTGAFAVVPEVEPDEDSMEEPAIATGAGYGLLILLGGSAAVIVMSFFARKKVPYSIFDK